MNFLDPRQWFQRPRARQRQLGIWSQHGLQVYRWLLAALVIAILTYLSPHQRHYGVPDVSVGTESPIRFEAPIRFEVPKSQEQFDAELREAERSVPTRLLRYPHVGENQLARLDSVLEGLLPPLRVQIPDAQKREHLQRALPHVIGGLSEETVNTLISTFSSASPAYVEEFERTCRQVLADLYRTGILPSKRSIEADVTQQVSLDGRELPISALNSEEELRHTGDITPHMVSYGPTVARDVPGLVHELLAQFIAPNLTLDEAETRRLRTRARGSVARIERMFSPDELIVAKGAIVTAKHRAALDALAEKWAEQELQDPLQRFQQLFADLALAAFMILVLGYYLASQQSSVYQRPGHLLLLAIIVIATVAISSSIRTNVWHTYLAPTPLAAMLATILLSPQVGLVLSFALAFLVGGLFGDFYVALTCALTGAVAVYSVRHVRHRNQFFRSMIFLPASYALLIIAADLLRFVPLDQISRNIVPGVAIGVVAPILTMGLLPVFETLFHITTDITLLELSDLNRPLLRNLAIRASGTYTHSLIMANLSESAAEAIGANPLLARVGSYYHDIGKMVRPEYFSENQSILGGRNPHDHLTPNMSMLVLSSHVENGLALAEEHGLPKAISSLIPEHHGTTVLEYFYNRAIELGDESVREDDFRYDGPKPQTKEAGILMVADSVESAARTLTERTPNRVRQLVRNIIQRKFNGGELDECDLTLQDLNRIEESFIPILMGTLHGRVEYPWQKEQRRPDGSPANRS